jgi:uncharacterized protein (TIGR03083 family)
MDLVPLIVSARTALADDLAPLPDVEWKTPSLCGDWTVEETLAHLTSAAAITPLRWIGSMVLAGFRPSVHNRRRMAEHLGAGPADTLARFRAVAGGTRFPSGHLAGWLGEVVVHGEDIRRPLGLTGGPGIPALTAVAEFYASRNFAVASRTVADGLRLSATDGPFTAGAGPVVTGPTLALVMAMAGRPAALADLTGDGVAELGSRIS